MKKEITRCAWPSDDELMIKYHDTEWGVPVLDDRKMFEFMILDAFQAGLSWRTILHRRMGFKKAFANFDYKKIAQFTTKDITRLMKDTGIIRNRLKIESAIKNACALIEVQKEFGSFTKYIWSFVEYQPIHNKIQKSKDTPCTSSVSDTMSKDLKKRGFSFVGSTICYAFMQAAGMVNDHLINCFRYKEVKKYSSLVKKQK